MTESQKYDKARRILDSFYTEDSPPWNVDAVLSELREDAPTWNEPADESFVADDDNRYYFANVLGEYI